MSLAGTGMGDMNTNWALSLGCTQRHPSHDYSISTENELLEVVSQVISEKEGAFSLAPFGRGHDKESLLCGVEGDLAFAHFMPRHPSDPRGASWATLSEAKHEYPEGPDDSFVGFNVWGTLTEVPPHRCIPVDVMVAICKYYFASVSLFPGVRWEPHWSPPEDEGEQGLSSSEEIPF